MVDTITTLIEKAIQTENDNEALACLQQVRKAYRGTGSVVSPKRVKQTPETVEVKPGDGVALREKDARIAYLDERIRNLESDNARLSGENANLVTKAMQDGNKADAELITKTTASMRKLRNTAIVGWVVAACAVTLFFAAL